MGSTVSTEDKKPKDAKDEIEIQGLDLEDPAEQAERMQKLVTGRIAPSSDVVGYMVAQLRKVFHEQDQVNKQLQAHQTAVRQAENRARELLGMRQKYIEDIQTWDRKARDAENTADSKADGKEKAPAPQ